MADQGPMGPDVPLPQPGRRSRGKGSSSTSWDCPSSCDGCDPCDLFNISLLGLIAVRVPTRAPRRRASGPALAGVAAIRAYQKWLSPRLPTACRHTPTCSRYGIAALRRYGLAYGVRLTAGRIGRCTADVPRGTHDPVP